MGSAEVMKKLGKKKPVAGSIPKVQDKKVMKKKKPAAGSIPKVQEKKVMKKKKVKKSVASDTQERDTIESLLEPFSKEQVITLVTDLSLTHESLFSLVKTAADGDISHRKIFVHGLAWDATQQIVESVFGAYGEMEDLNVVTDRTTGKCKGYAFITFKNRKSVKRLLENPRVQVGNRLTSCQLASEGPIASATGTGGVVSHQVFSSDYPQRKIYVNNVPANASVEKLRAFFEKFGAIEIGPKGVDPATGRFKGYAIFVYKTLEGAKKVLEQPFKFFEGSQLLCQKATDDKGKRVGGLASITTVMQPLQPQMLSAVAAAQQAQKISLLGQQEGLIHPLHLQQQQANLGVLMGGYYGMIGDQAHGLGAYGASPTVEVGSVGARHQGLKYMFPNTQTAQTSTSLAGPTASLGSRYPSSL